MRTPQPTSETVTESEDPDVDQTQQGEEQIEDEGPTIQEEEDKSEESFDLP